MTGHIGDTMTCPEHGFALVPLRTQYGMRYHCPKVGCTVTCWEGKTSTPADAETRRLRMRCHDAFDMLWRSGRMSRNAAYRWLAKELGIPCDSCHIGMMDKATCTRVLEVLNARTHRSASESGGGPEAVRSLLGTPVPAPDSRTGEMP